ncbi:MAG: acyltransferase [Bacteroidales bacterium]
MKSDKRTELIKKIFSLKTEDEFVEIAMEIFAFQSQHNDVYKKYLHLLGTEIQKVSSFDDIPFLPVSMFKTHRVITGNTPAGQIFKSSGTGGGRRSYHYIADPGLYKASYLRCFELFYGSPGNYCILALLPSYLERSDSSLVYMAGGLAEKSRHPESGFYLNDHTRLAETIKELERNNRNVLLMGVSFALLDLVEKHSLPLKNTIVMETGGMKGRRKEMTREELHSIIISKTGLKNVHSEYGMTEMFSQAYSKGEGKFRCPPWMAVKIRDVYDPFTYLPEGRRGGVNVIDLANIDSCAFLETADLGRMLPGGEFEILGRFDNSDIRGCNLLSV